MKYIIKRDGRKVPFNKRKIENAIYKAFEDVDGEVSEWAMEKASNIAKHIEEEADKSDKDFDIEFIQDMVETGLMSTKRKDVARSYITYRNERTRERNRNSKLMIEVGEKLTASNVQNQNANVDEYSFGGRMGEARNVLTKKYALDFLVSKKVRENHLNNRIYIHDLDSYASGMHNCFQRSTKFITDSGVKSFYDFNDGSVVKVMSIDGKWHDATVRYYGKQKMNKLILKGSGKSKEVICTPNHRWVLYDKSVTDNLQIEDITYSGWKVTNITPIDGEYEAWCVEEPDTHTFMLDDNIITGNCMSIPFDKLLSEGFNTRQTDIRAANSANTAFQLLAVIFQIQSLQQFGGVAATHLDWTMVPFVRKSFFKHYMVAYIKTKPEFLDFDLEDMIFDDYTDNAGIERNKFDDWLDENKEKCLNELGLSKEDFKFENKDKLDSVLYQSALYDTISEVKQAVEAMYHNLNSLQSRSGRIGCPGI